MDKDKLKLRCAEISYNVIFGAKRHFSTFDIVEKVPTYFGVSTTAIGIYQLAYRQNSTTLSVIITSIGVALIYLNFYNSEKDKYVSVGKKLTDTYNKLRSLFNEIDQADTAHLAILEQKLNETNSEYQQISLHKQVFGSGVFAHYKLFCEATTQSKWLVKELRLTLWKDMVPASTKVLAVVVLIGISVWVIDYLDLFAKIKTLVGP